MSKINKDNVCYQFLAQNKSFTPLSIYGLSGKSFLQNFLFNYTKDSKEYNTRESSSILWGFLFKNNIGKKINLNFKHSGQYSIMSNNYNISEASFSEISPAFNSSNFTIWNIGKFNYHISPDISFNINSSSNVTSSFYDNYDSTLSLDSLRYKTEIYEFLAGVKFNRFFFGFDLSATSFDSDIVRENSVNIYPYISTKVLDFRDIEISMKHSNKSTFSELPYDSISQNTPFMPHMLSMQTTEAIINRAKKNLDMKASVAYVSMSKHYTSLHSNTDYFYSNLRIGYLYNNLSLFLSYKSYDSVNTSDGEFYLPIFNRYLNYFVSYESQVRDKDFSIELKINGRLSKIKNSAFNFNSLPMIKVDGVDGEDSVHYIDLSGALKFKNFTISYHNITNGGSKFGLNEEMSDMGGAFTLPTYTISSREVSIFHYLKVSWSFLD